MLVLAVVARHESDQEVVSLIPFYSFASGEVMVQWMGLSLAVLASRVRFPPLAKMVYSDYLLSFRSKGVGKKH